ncbi:MAG: DoxX family protein [candidate division Zixibacteria bacterium]|nr:DoxX family protein [candidate division Zixibacteria bacterium]
MERQSSGWAPFFLRLALGAIFLAHGVQKFLTQGAAGVGSDLSGMGFPIADILAIALIVVEVVGGLFFIIGLLTRIMGIFLAVTMAVSLFVVHLPHGFFLPGGIEFHLLLTLASFSLVYSGAGKLSLDGLLFGRNKSALAEN